ncbi:MAG TPA: MFS transporter [Longimicrobiales bacterium]
MTADSNADGTRSHAFHFVLAMGLVDLFGDTAYSGGAGMNGPFLGSLGATAAVVSLAGGLSEFLNYLTRGASGYVGNRFRRRWLLIFVGYGLNLLAVPALALAGTWHVAAGLIVLQGIGRGLRKPIVQAMLSYTTRQHGRGWVYGVNTALDHTGRMLGPLVIALVLLRSDATFRIGYGLLLIPATLALIALVAARIRFPVPSKLEHHPAPTTGGFTRAYWLFLVAGACFAAGVMNFELIGFHISRSGVRPEAVPLFLVLATGVSAGASLGLGKLYDRIGMPVIVAAVLLSAMFSPFVFLLPIVFLLPGMALWGIGQVTQDMLLSALVAGVLPEGRRYLAFGVFYAGYGFGWLIGAGTAGFLYERSHLALVVFAAGVQLLSLPFLLLGRRMT